MVYLDNINSNEVLGRIKYKEESAKTELSCFIDYMASGLEEIAPQLDGSHPLNLIIFIYEKYTEDDGFIDDSDIYSYYLTSENKILCSWHEVPGDRNGAYIIEDDITRFLNHQITSSDSAKKCIDELIYSVNKYEKEHNLKIELPKIFSSYKEARQKLEVQA